ncbi:putative transcriptional regulator, LysR family protein [Gordonia spumicola]|uniref:Putative transcriptional regulator, LysR family protein n=1 Tax=Gordonia spumicola TaxID=589161 RepID=A0A7I9V567_9ACTN|nr:LysR family substrate-binding domain-containing protein [Gordonia spumicola]GEE00324.1 putative transcriptional regulator, LysR family protein [Gordonia spumicola]
MTSPETPRSLTLAYVPGATPAKWVRIWRERFPDIAIDLVALDVAATASAVAGGVVDIAITRLPDALNHGDAGPHHTISLYEETTVVVLPKDHGLTAGDELTFDDVADESFLWPLEESLALPARPGVAVDHRPETVADAIELVAAGVGQLVVPQSLARLHHRKDLVYRPLVDAQTSTVGLLWPDPTSELCAEFIGIVRGRKATSSRGRSEPAPKRSAKEKAAAKQARRQAAGKVPGTGKGSARRRSR